MAKLKIKDVIQDDLSSIKNELIENPTVFIQKLIESLGLVKKKAFSAYKEDLSLSYLKIVYEKAYPHKKRGGTHVPKEDEGKKIDEKSSLDQKTLSVVWDKSVPLVERAIVINLLKGVQLLGDVPSFVMLIGMRSKLASTAIRNKIRVGNYIVNCTEASKSIALFRNNKISHTKFLNFIIRKEKKKRNSTR